MGEWSVPAPLVGGEGGDDFEFQGSHVGATLRRLRVWVDPFKVDGVLVELSDGESKMFGWVEGEAHDFVFRTGERIASLSIWDNGEGSRLGGFRIVTTHGREFFPKMTEGELVDERKMDVGSGICVGVRGRCGEDLDSLSFICVKELRSCKMADVKYPTLSRVVPNIQQITLLRPELEDSTDGRYIAEETLGHRQSWSKTTGFQFALGGYKIRAPVPILEENQFHVGPTVNADSTEEKEMTSLKTQRWEFPIWVEAHPKLKMEIMIRKAEVSVPYTATMVATTKDDDELEFYVKGLYEGIAYSNARINIASVKSVIE